MAKPRNIKNIILELKNQGLSNSDVAKQLKCSKSSITYHLSLDCRNKSKLRLKKLRMKYHPYKTKTDRFLLRHTNGKVKPKHSAKWKSLLHHKIKMFCMTHQQRKIKNMNKSVELSPNNFTYKDVLEKFGETPKCYLTGKNINIYDPRTYQFDHIVPVSRGGDCSLDNLGICTKQANSAKSDMTKDEFINFCREVIKYQDSIKVTQAGVEPAS